METLHPRVRVAWALFALGAATGLGVGAFLADRAFLHLGAWLAPAVALPVAAAGLALAVLRYRVWRFELQDDALYLERGVVTRTETVVPYVRVQHIDTERGPIERSLGLASVVVYTAGSRGADVAVPGLRRERARGLADRLRERAVAAEPANAV